MDVFEETIAWEIVDAELSHISVNSGIITNWFYHDGFTWSVLFFSMTGMMAVTYYFKIIEKLSSTVKANRTHYDLDLDLLDL